jgi:hypothetical protein
MNRLIVLNRIYEAADGSTLVHIAGPALLADRGMPDDELADAREYLVRERLIDGTRTSWGKPIPYMMNLTHRGLKELEKSRSQLETPTERFPEFTVIHIGGDNLGPIQAGSPGASQATTINVAVGLDADSLLKVLHAYDADSAQLAEALPAEDAAALQADMETVRITNGLAAAESRRYSREPEVSATDSGGERDRRGRRR